MNPAEIDTPLYGVAGEPIEGELLQSLLERQAAPNASGRKCRAQRALDIYENRPGAQILDGIRLQQNSKTIATDMRRFLTNVRNDARDIAEQVAVVWKNDTDRHLALESDEAKEVASAVLRVLAYESQFDIKAELVNRLAYIVGPQFGVPIVRGREGRRRLCCDVIGPHVSDIVQDQDDELGLPVGLAWPVRRERFEGAVTESYVLDTVSLRRIGHATKDLQRLDVVEHNAGYLPAGLMRLDIPLTGDDWWKVDPQPRLTAGTIQIGVKLARLGLVRRGQTHKLLTAVGRLEGTPKGQEVGDPEGGIQFPTNTPDAVKVNVFDYDTPPANFINEILFWVLSMVEPLGGRIVVNPGEPDIYGRIEIAPKAQAEHRRRQIRPAMDYERGWWSGTTVMLNAEDHAAAKVLPSPDDVTDLLRVNFGQLSMELEDPAQAQAQADWELSRGLTSEIQIMRQRLGGVSKEEAQAEIERNLDERKVVNDMLAARNQPRVQDGSVMTAPEANGAQGTPAREANRRAEDQADADPSGDLA